MPPADRCGLQVPGLGRRAQLLAARPRLLGGHGSRVVDRLRHPLAYIAEPTLALYVIANSEARRDEVQHVLD